MENKDLIIHAVVNKIMQRSEVGQKKYGTTLKENTSDNYLQHLQEELMDAANYIEVLIQQQKDITEVVKSEPNDTDLGRKVRWIYGR